MLTPISKPYIARVLASCRNHFFRLRDVEDMAIWQQSLTSDLSRKLTLQCRFMSMAAFTCAPDSLVSGNHIYGAPMQYIET